MSDTAAEGGQIPRIDDEVTPATQTHMRLHLGEPWATFRRVGWLDQKGRVWVDIPHGADFDGGSLVPLLIPPET